MRARIIRGNVCGMRGPASGKSGAHQDVLKRKLQQRQCHLRADVRGALTTRQQYETLAATFTTRAATCAGAAMQLRRPRAPQLSVAHHTCNRAHRKLAWHITPVTARTATLARRVTTRGASHLRPHAPRTSAARHTLQPRARAPSHLAQGFRVISSVDSSGLKSRECVRDKSDPVLPRAPTQRHTSSASVPATAPQLRILRTTPRTISRVFDSRNGAHSERDSAEDFGTTVQDSLKHTRRTTSAMPARTPAPRREDYCATKYTALAADPRSRGSPPLARRTTITVSNHKSDIEDRRATRSKRARTSPAIHARSSCPLHSKHSHIALNSARARLAPRTTKTPAAGMCTTSKRPQRTQMTEDSQDLVSSSTLHFHARSRFPTLSRAALARGLSNSSATRYRLERPPIPRFAPRRSVRDRFRPLATDQLRSHFPTSPHSRAAFTLQHRRARDRRKPAYNSSRPAKACATAHDASHPLDPAQTQTVSQRLGTVYKPHNPYSTGVFQHTRPPRRGAFFGAIVLAVFSAVEGASTDNASHKLCGLPTSAVRDPNHADVVAYDPNPNLASPTMPPPVPAFKTQVALQ
ncbi:hypothetical protein EDB84DRAFT_1446266 [Lactarius hengduanensis]|nr:hypothetical protein EDB84DRAFT_1446266 [Lactarius hengduanensis]